MEKEKFRNKYRIQSARLNGWDYSNAGWYFVTICTQDRFNYFGEIKNDEMRRTKIGEMAKRYWLEIPQHFPLVKLDEFIVMPNHIHGILIINNNGRDEALPRLYQGKYPQMAKISPKPKSLSVIIGSFKSICAKKIREYDLAFTWQPRFYDHIIRNEKSLNNIRQYIIDNPKKWQWDRNNQIN